MGQKAHQLGDKFVLRFPTRMRDAIKRAAETNGRSMNAEIIHRLKKADPAGLHTGPGLRSESSGTTSSTNGADAITAAHEKPSTKQEQKDPAEAATSPGHGSTRPYQETTMNRANDTSEQVQKATGESWFEVATAQEYTVGYIQILSGMAAAVLISEGEAQLAIEGGGFIVPGKAFDQAIALLRAVELMSAHPMEAGR